MFPSKLFRFDPKTRSIIGEATRLACVRGSSAIFEDFGNEDFGLKMITNNGLVTQWIVKNKIESGDRLTFVLKSPETSLIQMVIVEKLHAC